ncbi:Abi family protein [Bengtsoniella intestinalis]|uniref:Abi family protein n=1 Tax=Bengtsoniella intestinalis TaxID=3073143 RepID=UPI00391F1E4A
MPITKEHKSIEDRITILENRGLKFRNKQRAICILTKYNYFDIINGFESILLSQSSPTKMFDDVYFEDFYDLYQFDMCLKKHTLFLILDIESRLKTSVSYHFTGKYCDTAAKTLEYVNPQNYCTPVPNDTHLSKAFSKHELFETTQRYNNGTFKSKSFLDRYNKKPAYMGQYQKPPFWVAIKQLTFGPLYYLFLFLDNNTQAKVLNDFNFDSHDLKAYQQAMFILNKMRNECAHLELVSRFKLKHDKNLNFFAEIIALCNLSKTDICYRDVLKILHALGSTLHIRIAIGLFYLKMSLKGRRKIAQKILGKMGRKSIYEWLVL